MPTSRWSRSRPRPATRVLPDWRSARRCRLRRRRTRRRPSRTGSQRSRRGPPAELRNQAQRARNARGRDSRNNSFQQRRSQVNFQINDESIDGDTHVIELGGEVDLYTAPEFKERLVQVIEDGKKHLVVDLSK